VTGGEKWCDRGYLRAWLVGLGDSVSCFRSSKCSWVRLGQPVRRDAAYSSWRVDRHRRYVRAKGNFGWSILNSLAVGLRACRVPVLREFPHRHCSTQCRDGEDGVGWRLLDLNGLLFIYSSFVESMIVCNCVYGCNSVVREHTQDLRTRVKSSVHCMFYVGAWCYARGYVQPLRRVCYCGRTPYSRWLCHVVVQWRTEEGGLGCSNPPPPRNSEDIGGTLDRMSKKNRRIDFLL